MPDATWAAAVLLALWLPAVIGAVWHAARPDHRGGHRD